MPQEIFLEILAKTKGPLSPFGITLILFYFMPASFLNSCGVFKSPTCPIGFG
jgi:hypothetical protein